MTASLSRFAPRVPSGLFLPRDGRWAALSAHCRHPARRDCRRPDYPRQRGITPINSSGDFLASGIIIDVTGDNADDARTKGWREAQRKGWAQLTAS